MQSRQPPASLLPRLWLMTDERQGDALWSALATLPRGAGVIFRHYATPAADRRACYERVRRVARSRGLMLILAGEPREATAWRADGAHGRSRRQGGSRPLIRTASAHNRRELVDAERMGADLVLLSPAFATRSHAGARSLGRVRFMALARQARLPVIALGGMNARRARSLGGIYGWAGIDAWNVRRGSVRT